MFFNLIHTNSRTDWKRCQMKAQRCDMRRLHNILITSEYAVNSWNTSPLLIPFICVLFPIPAFSFIPDYTRVYFLLSPLYPRYTPVIPPLYPRYTPLIPPLYLPYTSLIPLYIPLYIPDIPVVAPVQSHSMQ